MGRTGLQEELRFELGPAGEKELPWGRHLGRGYCRAKAVKRNREDSSVAAAHCGCGWGEAGAWRKQGPFA